MKQVLLILPRGFEELEAAAFTDVFGWSRAEGIEPVGLVTAGLRDKVRCTWNFTVLPEHRLQDIDLDSFDALALPGGFEEEGFYEDAFDERILETVRAFHHAGKWIAAVCVGALCLGRAGILEGKRATTYHLSGGHRRRQLAQYGANVVDERIVEDHRILTSTAPETALDVAFRLLERLTGPENTAVVRREMGYRD
ncbi:DJ-1 family protein [bacterium]|nr:DJ-1 family protein [bacterium]